MIAFYFFLLILSFFVFIYSFVKFVKSVGLNLSSMTEKYLFWHWKRQTWKAPQKANTWTYIILYYSILYHTVWVLLGGLHFEFGSQCLDKAAYDTLPASWTYCSYNWNKSLMVFTYHFNSYQVFYISWRSSFSIIPPPIDTHSLSVSVKNLFSSFIPL